MESLAHKIELDPTNKQKTYFRKACGIARFTWNWALSNWNDYYLFNLALPKEDRDSISGLMLKKEFNQIKRKEYPWTTEVSKYVAQQPFIQLGRAYSNFFKKIAKKPKFKKKNKSKDSFYIGGDQIKVNAKKIWVPNLGWVRLKERLRFRGQIRSATFSRSADRWYVAIQVDTVIKKKKPLKKCIGVDLGLNKMVQLSNGEYFTSPKPLKNNLRILKRRQRRLAKKTYQSKNYEKQRIKVQKVHLKVSNIRKDTINKITTNLVERFETISIEDLNVSGMLKNHKLSRAIADIGFYEFRRQLEYKSKIYGNHVFIADRFYPSSKKCFKCEDKNESLSLKDRLFSCNCSFEIDRDLNAALNLERLVNQNLRTAGPNVRPTEVTAMVLGTS